MDVKTIMKYHCIHQNWERKKKTGTKERPSAANIKKRKRKQEQKKEASYYNNNIVL